MSERGVGLSAIGLGIFLAIGSLTIQLGSGYDRIGPRFFPYLVAVGLILTGSWLAYTGNNRKPDSADGAVDLRPRPLLWLGAGLLLSLVLFERAGFILSSSLLFWMVARSFRSERPVRDAGVAVVLSTLVYVIFTRGLGLVLPAGVLGWL